MAKNQQGVLAIFTYLDLTIDGIKSLQKLGRKDFEVFSPVPNHELSDALGEGRSPVRWITLLGAVSGFSFGAFLTLYTTQDWPIYTGGKDIWSIPAFSIAMYELTILLGGLFTLGGLIALCRLPNLNLGIYDPRFSSDKFGIFVPCQGPEKDKIRALLTEAGAEEINDADA